MSRKSETARLSILSNASLIIMKLVVGVITGSVSIISEAIHSTVDLLASIIAYFAVRIADVPPDDEHPYGHDKVENISGVIEAILVFAASGMIIFKSVQKLIDGTAVSSIGLGFGVMFVSAAVNTIVSKKLYKVAREEDSIALEADALHLKADVYTSLGVGFGLFLIWITDLTFLDPVIAIIIALLILKESVEMLRNAFRPLLDTKIPDEDIEFIKNTIEKHRNVCVDMHEIRTRKSGKTTHIDFHLTVPDDMTVKEAHDICDSIEGDIGRRIRYSKVLIHTESCGLAINEVKALKKTGAAGILEKEKKKRLKKEKKEENKRKKKSKNGKQ